MVSLTGIMVLILSIYLGPCLAQSEEDLYFEAITIEETASTKADFTRATEAYMKILKKYPSSENGEMVGASLYALGEIFLLRLQRGAEARWAFEEIQRRLPGTSWVQRAEERLEELPGVKGQRPEALRTGRGELAGLTGGLGIGVYVTSGKAGDANLSSGRKGITAASSGLTAGDLGMALGMSIPESAVKRVEHTPNTAGENTDAAFFADLGIGLDGSISGGNLRYQNGNAGFSLEIPGPDWAVTEDVDNVADGMECMIFRNPSLSPNQSDHVPSFNVIVRHFESPVNAIRLLSVVKESVDKMANVSLISEKGRRIGGSLVIIRKYETTFDKRPLKQLQGLWAAGEKAFILTGTFDSARAPEAEDDFMGIIESFRVE
jgi:hypothetical protein